MIYGTAWKKDNTSRLVELAIKTVFRAIDTACQPKHYNEKQVGMGISKALKETNLNRSDIFIQTKFIPIGGQDTNNIPYNPKDSLEKQIYDSLQVSLPNLQTDYIDSLILHSPIMPVEDTIKVWRVFESFIEEGLVKQIGISNSYDPKLLPYIYDIISIKPKVLQNRFHQQSGYDKELREFCNTHNIAYQSFWSLSANPHLLNSKTIVLIAKQHHKTVEQVFYKFLTQINITPLNGTTSEKHMKEDLDIVSFNLSIEEVNEINLLL